MSDMDTEMEDSGREEVFTDPFEAKRAVDKARVTVRNKREYLQHFADIDPRLPENPREHFGAEVWDEQVGGWLGFLNKLGPEPVEMPT